MEEDSPEFRALYEAKKQKSERMAQRMLHGEAVKLTCSPGFQNPFLFVYGTLMDPSMLKLLLGRDPKLWAAKVTSYKVMMWGPYPALVRERYQTVVGLAFEIDSEDELESLQEYETHYYREAACYIQLEGKEEAVVGKTFLWNGPKDELSEGRFDLEAWQKQRYFQQNQQ